MTLREQVSLLLKAAKIKADKKLGQHFLIDQAVLDQIISAAAIKPDETILEVGPGLGVLTAELVKRAGRVVAVERDMKMAEILTKVVVSPKLTIVRENILQFDLGKLPAYAVVANLPYYITAPIIRNFLTARHKPERLVVMVQREVGQRLTSEPPDSVLAFSAHYYGQPRYLFDVPRTSFWPVPEVDSAVIEITVRPRPVFEADPAKLFRLVKAAFGERRKQLPNSLAGGLRISQSVALQQLALAGISRERRPQELTVSEWKLLYAAFADLIK